MADVIHCKFSRQQHGDATVNGAKIKLSTYCDVTRHDGDPPETKLLVHDAYMHHWALGIQISDDTLFMQHWVKVASWPEFHSKK